MVVIKCKTEKTTVFGLLQLSILNNLQSDSNGNDVLKIKNKTNKEQQTNKQTNKQTTATTTTTKW